MSAEYNSFAAYALLLSLGVKCKGVNKYFKCVFLHFKHFIL
jgi:hypothetical protein